MKLVSLALALSSLLVAASSFISVANADGAAPAHEGEKPWGYRDSDPTTCGPSRWAELFPTCGGSRQSPVDIPRRSLQKTGVKAPLAFSGSCSHFNLTQTEEAYKAIVKSGSCAVSVCSGDKSSAKAEYSMLQLHMHAPSEHTLDGKVYDGEAHFVHQKTDGSGGLLVVGLLLKKKEGARTDPWLAKFWDSLQNIDAASHAKQIKLGSYSRLLAAVMSKGRVFNYAGSLTTPACSEIVDWWVLGAALHVAPADFDRFMGYLKKLPATNGGHGARPVQPLNGRAITVY